MNKVGGFLFEWKRVNENKTDGDDFVYAAVSFNSLVDLKRYWPGGKLPKAVPKCGFKEEKCKKEAVKGGGGRKFDYLLL